MAPPRKSPPELDALAAKRMFAGYEDMRRTINREAPRRLRMMQRVSRAGIGKLRRA